LVKERVRGRRGLGYIVNKGKRSDAEGWGNRQFKAGKQKEAVILKGVDVKPHHLQIPHPLISLADCLFVEAQATPSSLPL
ncbi:hypothetical protein BHE74_00058428, partial [Ensete ventricosum]